MIEDREPCCAVQLFSPIASEGICEATSLLDRSLEIFSELSP